MTSMTENAAGRDTGDRGAARVGAPQTDSIPFRMRRFTVLLQRRGRILHSHENRLFLVRWWMCSLAGQRLGAAHVRYVDDRVVETGWLTGSWGL
jgi:hypothetical protein